MFLNEIFSPLWKIYVSRFCFVLWIFKYNTEFIKNLSNKKKKSDYILQHAETLFHSFL